MRGAPATGKNVKKNRKNEKKKRKKTKEKRENFVKNWLCL
jgi:hypothetical protein